MIGTFEAVGGVWKRRGGDINEVGQGQNGKGMSMVQYIRDMKWRGLKKRGLGVGSLGTEMTYWRRGDVASKWEKVKTREAKKVLGGGTVEMGGRARKA